MSIISNAQGCGGFSVTGWNNLTFVEAEDPRERGNDMPRHDDPKLNPPPARKTWLQHLQNGVDVVKDALEAGHDAATFDPVGEWAQDNLAESGNLLLDAARAGFASTPLSVGEVGGLLGTAEGNVGEVCEFMAGRFVAGAGNHLVGELADKANAALPADIQVVGVVGYIYGTMYAAAGLAANTTICRVFDGNTVKLDFNATVNILSSWSTVQGFYLNKAEGGVQLDLWSPDSMIGLTGDWTIDPYGNTQVGVGVSFHF